MEPYLKYAKNNQPVLILALMLLCLVLIGGVTYDTILLNQTKIKAIQAVDAANQADSDAQQADSDAQQADQDIQNTDSDVQNVCSALSTC